MKHLTLLSILFTSLLTLSNAYASDLSSGDKQASSTSLLIAQNDTRRAAVQHDSTSSQTDEKLKAIGKTVPEEHIQRLIATNLPPDVVTALLLPLGEMNAQIERHKQDNFQLVIQMRQMENQISYLNQQLSHGSSTKDSGKMVDKTFLYSMAGMAVSSLLANLILAPENLGFGTLGTSIGWGLSGALSASFIGPGLELNSIGLIATGAVIGLTTLSLSWLTATSASDNFMGVVAY